MRRTRCLPKGCQNLGKDPFVLTIAESIPNDSPQHHSETKCLTTKTADEKVHIASSSLYNSMWGEKTPTVYVGRLRKVNREVLGSAYGIQRSRALRINGGLMKLAA